MLGRSKFVSNYKRGKGHDGRKSLAVLREYYQGKGKPSIIALYTELTSSKKSENENTTDYMLRAETVSAALKSAEEVISDGLLLAMILKGLPRSYKTFSTVVIQREKPMTFSEFKTALRNYEENEKSCKTEDQDNVMYTEQQKRFDGKCLKCDKKGHKSSDCWTKSEKWCTNTVSRYVYSFTKLKCLTKTKKKYPPTFLVQGFLMISYAQASFVSLHFVRYRQEKLNK
jgi:hypothetical protein